MPRTRRLLFTGHPLHVVHRGVNRGACFRDESDRVFYLGLLQEHLPDSGCELHACVLMTNHVHLLFTPKEDAAAAHLMKAVAQRYTQRVRESIRSGLATGSPEFVEQVTLATGRRATLRNRHLSAA